MISPADRRNAVKLIRVANGAGASACQELQISLRTYQRWCQGGDIKVDGRPEASRSAPVQTHGWHHARRLSQKGSPNSGDFTIEEQICSHF